MNTFTSIQKSRTLFLLFMLSFTVLTGAFRVCAQTIGDYRSVASGNWTALATWQYYNGNAWVAATAYPGQNTGIQNVSIIGGFEVTLNASIPNQFTSLTIGDDIFPPTQTIFDKLIIPDNSNYTLNTILVTIKDDATIYWYKKGNLNLLTNGVLIIYNTSGTATLTNPLPLSWEGCSANNEIHFGTPTSYVMYATCSGGGGQYSFPELNAAGVGGTINAVINSPTNDFCQATSVPLQGSFTGVFGTTTSGGSTSGVNYYWYVNGSTTPVASGIITVQNTLHTAYNLPTSPGVYNLEFKVTSYNASTIYTNSEFFTFTVYPTSVAGTASSNQTICYNTAPTQLSLTGSVGTIQWQSSTDNSTFINITGATSSTYSPGALTQTTYYRAIVKSGVCSQASSNTVTITVIPASVGGTATADKPTVCSGYGTTIRLSAYTGTIQWQSSPDNTIWNNIAGETLATYTTPNLTTTTYYRAVVTSGSCTSAYSTVASVTVTANMWEGNVSEIWDDVANWTCKVPLTGEDVVFSNSAANNLLLDQDRTIGSLSNSSTKALIIRTTKSLTINGTATVNAADRILIQSAAGVANGSLIFTQPTLNANVPATVEMYSKAYKGAPITYTDSNTGGTYTVSYRWQYFGIPVKDAKYNDNSKATFTTAPVSYVRKSNELLNGDNIYYNEWEQLYDDASLTTFTGYEITQLNPKTITFKGPLVTGDQTLNLTYTATPGGIFDTGSGYNIFGNSYTAAIDINKMQFATSGVEKAVYLYNTGSLHDWYEATGDVVPGSYLAIPQNTSGEILREIPSMQGFMLIATAGSTVTIPYNSVIKNMEAQRAPSADNSALSYLTIDVISKSGGDRVWLFSQPGTSRKYDNGWDGRKIILNPGLSLFVDEGKDQLQVSTSDDLDKTYLSFMAGKDTEYTCGSIYQNSPVTRRSISLTWTLKR